MSLAALAVLGLGSCSSVYELRAVMVEGQLVFEPTETDFWGDPECAKTIDLVAVNGPLGGDGRLLWRRGSTEGPCDLAFPIIYGSPKYDHLVNPSTGSIGPKPFPPGLTFEVTALSPGSAHGSGRFRFDEDGKVINLR